MQSLAEPLRRLDRDIAELESRLAELRAMRANVQPFIERYGAADRDDQHAEQPVETRPPSLTDEVIKVFEDRPGEVLDVDDTLAHVQDNGVHTSRVAVRNAINYAVRLGKVTRDEHRRGRYTLRDTSTPAATGVDVGEEPNSEGSSREIGGNRNGSIPLRDQGGDAHDAQNHLDRLGDRAPIGG